MDAIWGMQGSSLSLSAVMLGLVALAHVCLRSWIRHKVRQDNAEHGDASSVRHWVAVGLAQIAPAVLALMWINGIHAILSVLLPGMTSTLVEPARQVLSWSYGLSFLAALFW